MTPKEKALELIEKMEAEIPFTASPSAAQCAMVVVNEMLAINGFPEHQGYWQLVRRELENQ